MAVEKQYTYLGEDVGATKMTYIAYTLAAVALYYAAKVIYWFIKVTLDNSAWDGY